MRNIGFYARVNHGGHIQVFVASQMETLFNVPLPACILLKVRQDTGRCKPSVAANPNGFGATLNHIRFSPFSLDDFAHCLLLTLIRSNISHESHNLHK